MLRSLAVVLLALLVPVAPARAQSSPGDYTDLRTIPEGPHKARVEEYLDVVGAGDAERLEVFFREALAPSHTRPISMRTADSTSTASGATPPDPRPTARS
jgi:hypothetical protein